MVLDKREPVCLVPAVALCRARADPLRRVPVEAVRRVLADADRVLPLDADRRLRADDARRRRAVVRLVPPVVCFLEFFVLDRLALRAMETPFASGELASIATARPLLSARKRQTAA